MTLFMRGLSKYTHFILENFIKNAYITERIYRIFVHGRIIWESSDELNRKWISRAPKDEWISVQVFCVW